MRVMRTVVMASALMLAACGGGEGKLLGKSLPDETRVIDGPTLALPPQFELRPPREGSDYETVLRARTDAEARQLITGVSATTAATAPAAGDAWLVDKTAAQSGVVADGNIREELKAAEPAEKEAEKQELKKKGLFQRWFSRSN